MSTSNERAAVLEVPAVTEDDLRNFQQVHFGDAHVTGTSLTQHEEAENCDEDDQLGLYPDGVRRTLTDEQIAIFRHSEIQTLLRERRLRLENADCEDEVKEPESSRRLSEEAADLRSVRRTSSPNRNADQPTKRKWTEFVKTSEENPDNFTYRRLARELDEVPTSSVDLLYGEEEPLTPASLKPRAQITIPPSTRNMITYGQSDHSHATEERPPTDGLNASKFIWPRLGAANT